MFQPARAPHPRPPPHSFTKQEPQGRKGGEAGGRKGGGVNGERAAGTAAAPQPASRRWRRRPRTGIPVRRARRSPPATPPLTVPLAARAPVLSRPAAAPCPSSGSAPPPRLPPPCTAAAPPTDERRPRGAALSTESDQQGEAPSPGPGAEKLAGVGGFRGGAPGSRLGREEPTGRRVASRGIRGGRSFPGSQEQPLRPLGTPGFPQCGPEPSCTPLPRGAQAAAQGWRLLCPVWSSQRH